MYKYQNDILKLIKYIKLSVLIILTSILYLSFSIIPSYAQSAASVDFSITIDKSTVAPNDTMTFTYKLTNNSAASTIYNAKVGFNYLDKLTSTTFTGSSTGLSLDNLKSNGYPITNFAPGKSISFLLYFKLDSNAQVGSKVQNTQDNTSIITSTFEFRFSNDGGAPVFTKDAVANLPSIVASKPEIASLKYPDGITGFDLSTITADNVKSLSDFYIQGINKITYTESLDLSTPEAVNVIKIFKTFFDLNSQGSVNISDNVPFDKKANVEMKNLSFIDTPQIYLNDTKYTKPVTYDSKNKTAKFNIDGVGKYTLIGEVKTEIPADTSGKFLNIKGVLTDPSAKIEVEIEGNKIKAPIVDINSGNFEINHTFTEAGTKDIIFSTYAKNGVVNKQTFTTNLTGVDSTSTPVPTKIIAPPNDSSYFMAFLYSLLGIVVIGFLVAAYLIYVSLKRKKNTNMLNDLNSRINPDTTPMDVVNFRKQAELNNDFAVMDEDQEKDIDNTEENKFSPYIDVTKSGKIKHNHDVSENRHEVIRAKLKEHDEEKNKEENNTDNNLDNSNNNDISEKE